MGKNDQMYVCLYVCVCVWFDKHIYRPEEEKTNPIKPEK